VRSTVSVPAATRGLSERGLCVWRPRFHPVARSAQGSSSALLPRSGEGCCECRCPRTSCPH
jgi:hypothetical protein